MRLQLGQILNNRYQIIALLGQGGMGAVYRAHDQTLNRTVAIKERTPEPNASAQALTQTRVQFRTEAQVLGTLMHPNLPHTYDYFTFGANEYVAMELIEGQSLESVVEKFGAIEEWRVRAWANQVLDVLIYIHSHNVIHRDIKPANLILKPDGNVILVDFGLVKLFDPSNPNAQTVMRGMGTSGYAPLEQYAPGMHTDARSDIFSLGATLYHLLTARAPLEVHTRLLNPSALPRIRTLSPAVSPQTEAATLKAMEIYPQNRFQSAAEMKQALVGAPTVQVPRPQPPMVTAPPTQPYTPPVRADGGNWLKVTVAVALALIGLLGVSGIGFVALMSQSTPTPAPTAVPPTRVAITAAPTAVPPTRVPITAAPTVAPPTRVPITATPTPVPPTPASASSACSQAGLVERRGVDNAEMVCIPAGDFTMGSNDYNGEKPPHTVYLDAFWIDKYEVTNALYKKCVDAGKCSVRLIDHSHTRHPYRSNSSFDNYPVLYVWWNDANVYCAWAGKRLPTEAEWEKAARGTDGRTWPWGNTFDASRLNSGEGGRDDTTQVGSYPNGASPYGALDMAGNVWEWVADWYGETYYSSSPRNNPKGPSSGQYRVLRGGAWVVSQNLARAAYRGDLTPDIHFYNVGFRCAQ